MLWGLSFVANSNQEIWLTGGSEGTNNNGIGFKVLNGTLYAYLANSVGQTLTSMGGIVSPNLMQLEVVWTPGVGAVYSATGLPDKTLTTTLPSGLPGAEFVARMSVKTNTTFARGFNLSDLRILVEPS